MAKKNNNRVSSLDDIAARKAQLAAEMQKLNEEMENTRVNVLKDIEAKIQNLPEQFGVENLAEVRNLISRYERGSLFKATNKGNVSLNDEQKQNLLQRRRDGVPYSVLAGEFNVSAQTAFNYCKAAGLVTPRNAEVNA